MISLLEVNGIIIDFTNVEIEKLALEIASGKMNYDDVLIFIKNKC